MRRAGPSSLLPSRRGCRGAQAGAEHFSSLLETLSFTHLISLAAPCAYGGLQRTRLARFGLVRGAGKRGACEGGPQLRQAPPWRPMPARLLRARAWGRGAGGVWGLSCAQSSLHESRAPGRLLDSCAPGGPVPEPALRATPGASLHESRARAGARSLGLVLRPQACFLAARRRLPIAGAWGRVAGRGCRLLYRRGVSAALDRRGGAPRSPFACRRAGAPARAQLPAR